MKQKIIIMVDVEAETIDIKTGASPRAAVMAIAALCQWLCQEGHRNILPSTLRKFAEIITSGENISLTGLHPDDDVQGSA